MFLWAACPCLLGAGFGYVRVCASPSLLARPVLYRVCKGEALTGRAGYVSTFRPGGALYVLGTSAIR